mmetsp:Transcript_37186/g.52541  ORF Transcript_37186/g.52541 Transcript_37186/m.52541 type:complete len:272 (+) Transcript_37186:644-1459(+)
MVASFATASYMELAWFINSTTMLTASKTTSSFSANEEEARSIISTIMQFTTSPNTSAPCCLVIPDSSKLFSSSSTAFSNSNSSIGIPPGRAAMRGKRPGAPKVRSFARSLDNSGAVAPSLISTLRSVSRVFLAVNIDATFPSPTFFFFFFGVSVDDGEADDDSLLAAFGSGLMSFLVFRSTSTDPMKSSSLSSPAENGESLPSPSVIPISILNCRCLSASSTVPALSDITFLITTAPPIRPTATAAFFEADGFLTLMLTSLLLPLSSWLFC